MIPIQAYTTLALASPPRVCVSCVCSCPCIVRACVLPSPPPSVFMFPSSHLAVLLCMCLVRQNNKKSIIIASVLAVCVSACFSHHPFLFSPPSPSRPHSVLTPLLPWPSSLPHPSSFTPSPGMSLHVTYTFPLNCICPLSTCTLLLLSSSFLRILLSSLST